MKETKEMRWKRLYFKKKQVDIVFKKKHETGGDDTIDRYLFIYSILEPITEENAPVTITFFRQQEIVELVEKLGLTQQKVLN